jgi:hypothetical protein
MRPRRFSFFFAQGFGGRRFVELATGTVVGRTALCACLTRARLLLSTPRTAAGMRIASGIVSSHTAQLDHRDPGWVGGALVGLACKAESSSGAG